MMVVGKSLVFGDWLDAGGSVDTSVSLDSKDSLDVGNSADVCDSVDSVSADVGSSLDSSDSVDISGSVGVGASVASRDSVDSEDSADNGGSPSVEDSMKALLGTSIDEEAIVASVSGNAVEYRDDTSACEEVSSGGVGGEEDGSRDAPREEALEDSTAVDCSEADSVGSFVPERGSFVFVVGAALLIDDVPAISDVSEARGRVDVSVSSPRSTTEILPD
jgi:hypothetical protein